MEYSSLDRAYLRKLELSVLAHTAEQYRSALRVLQDDPNQRSQPLYDYLKRCLAAVMSEMQRRDELAEQSRAQTDQLAPDG